MSHSSTLKSFLAGFGGGGGTLPAFFLPPIFLFLGTDAYKASRIYDANVIPSLTSHRDGPIGIQLHGGEWHRERNSYVNQHGIIQNPTGDYLCEILSKH